MISCVDINATEIILIEYRNKKIEREVVKGTEGWGVTRGGSDTKILFYSLINSKLDL
jgi:hypothetical protein